MKRQKGVLFRVRLPFPTSSALSNADKAPAYPPAAFFPQLMTWKGMGHHFFKPPTRHSSSREPKLLSLRSCHQQPEGSRDLRLREDTAAFTILFRYFLAIIGRRRRDRHVKPARGFWDRIMGNESSTSVDESVPSTTLYARNLDAVARYIKERDVKRIVVMVSLKEVWLSYC